eukprot:4926913-Amphidinium_carterae.1
MSASLAIINRAVMCMIVFQAQEQMCKEVILRFQQMSASSIVSRHFGEGQKRATTVQLHQQRLPHRKPRARPSHADDTRLATLVESDSIEAR